MKIFSLIKNCLLLALFCSLSHAAFADNAKAEDPVFSIDFRRPEYKVSKPCRIAMDGVEFNPKCGQSWKLDRYNSKEGANSSMEIEVDIAKDESKSYVIEFQQCARKDAPELSRVSITVNGHAIVQGFNAYNGPNNIHYPNDKGEPWHLRWDVFEVTNELQNGKNVIRVSLDNNTQSGIAMSWLHVRPGSKE